MASIPMHGTHRREAMRRRRHAGRRTFMRRSETFVTRRREAIMRLLEGRESAGVS